MEETAFNDLSKAFASLGISTEQASNAFRDFSACIPPFAEAETDERTMSMDLYEKCERKDLPKQLGSGYICGGEWMYRFPIGDGTRELNPVCETCPHYAPGVTVIV